MERVPQGIISVPYILSRFQLLLIFTTLMIQHDFTMAWFVSTTQTQHSLIVFLPNKPAYPIALCRAAVSQYVPQSKQPTVTMTTKSMSIHRFPMPPHEGSPLAGLLPPVQPRSLWTPAICSKLSLFSKETLHPRAILVPFFIRWTFRRVYHYFVNNSDVLSFEIKYSDQKFAIVLYRQEKLYGIISWRNPLRNNVMNISSSIGRFAHTRLVFANSRYFDLRVSSLIIFQK